jgi:hypothetical protein
MSKSKHAESLVGKRISILSGENGGQVFEVLGVVYTFNLKDIDRDVVTQTDIAAYLDSLGKYVEDTFGVLACYYSHAGLNLVVKSGQLGYLIAVPRKNHYRVL